MKRTFLELVGLLFVWLQLLPMAISSPHWEIFGAGVIGLFITIWLTFKFIRRTYEIAKTELGVN